MPQVAAQRSASRLTFEPEGLVATSTSIVDRLQTPEQTADAKAEDAAAAAAAATAAAAAATAAAATTAAAAATEATRTAAAAAANEVSRDLGGDRDGAAPLERLPVATDSVVAEGQADEAAACAYSRHAWLLSNPVGVPPDLSATEQGASTVAATLGRADGVPVDPPGLTRN